MGGNEARSWHPRLSPVAKALISIHCSRLCRRTAVGTTVAMQPTGAEGTEAPPGIIPIEGALPPPGQVPDIEVAPQIPLAPKAGSSAGAKRPAPVFPKSQAPGTAPLEIGRPQRGTQAIRTTATRRSAEEAIREAPGAEAIARFRQTVSDEGERERQGRTRSPESGRQGDPRRQARSLTDTVPQTQGPSNSQRRREGMRLPPTAGRGEEDQGAARMERAQNK